MMLADVSRIRDRRGIEDLDEVNSGVASALKAASTHLSTAVRSPFDRATRSDRFYVPRDEWRSGLNFPVLRLAQGFVDDTQTVTVKMARSLNDLATAEPLAVEDYKLDAEKGAVSLLINPKADPLGRPGLDPYVQVDYTAGFETGTTIQGPKYKGVPVWLEEAAIEVGNNIFEGWRGDAPQSPIPEGAFALIDPHVRRMGYAVEPI